MADKNNAQEQSSEKRSSQQKQASQQSTSMAGGQASQGRQQRGLSRRPGYRSAMSLLSPLDLLTANPFDLMRRFTEELDQAFETFGLSGQTTGQAAIAKPAVDVFEREGNIVVRADMPGLKPDQVSVEATDDGIVIKGEASEEQEQRGENFYRRERSYGQFYRLIPLPEHADPEQAQAHFNNGVLEIMIPVAESRKKSRQIPVQSHTAQQSQAAGGQTKG